MSFNDKIIQINDVIDVIISISSNIRFEIKNIKKKILGCD